MKYENKIDLLANSEGDLSEHANLIYRKTFNEAYLKCKTRHKHRDGMYHDEYAHKIELSILKSKYKRGHVFDKWRNNDSESNYASAYA